MILNENSLVSVIMPTYKCGGFIEKSIKSVQAQTYSNWELIVVDDCSGDGTIDIVLELKKSDNRISIYQNSSNSGAAVTRNTAIRNAKGRWIAFLDSDDLWEPTKLEKQIKFMEEMGYAFTYHEYVEIDEQDRELGVKVSGKEHVGKFDMFACCWPGCLSVMYDAETVGLVQIADIKKNNDYAMWLKVCQKADCYLLDEELALYRRGRVGSVSTHGIKTMIGWHYKLFRESEGQSMVASALNTGRNMVFGFIKKIHYVKKQDVERQDI